MGDTFRSTSVKNPAAQGRDVIEIISPPPGPYRNQCVDPPGMCTSVPESVVLLRLDAEVDLSADHVERLVPGVMMGRRPAPLGPGLAEDLVTSGLGAVGEDGDLLADDLECLRAVLGCNYHRWCGHCLPLSVLASHFAIVISY